MRTCTYCHTDLWNTAEDCNCAKAKTMKKPERSYENSQLQQQSELNKSTLNQTTERLKQK